MKLTITTLIIVEDNEVQDVIHSFNEDLTKAKEEIVDQVNNVYGHKNLFFKDIHSIWSYFDIVHLECQEISLQPNRTVIKDTSLLWYKSYTYYRNP